MSGGEVRVLRQEAGQESPRMPAWKREILERRKAKSGAGAAAAEPGPGSSPQRVNGEATGGGGGGSSDGSSRNYSVATASQHFAGRRAGSVVSPDLSPLRANKDPAWATEPPPHDAAERGGEGPESLVLHESLGPLQENPFIKLEKERKRRQDRENAARPVQHILELYGSVPGIRTIRAENIIIIESDPDYFPEASGLNAGSSRLQHNGVSSYSSLNDLLDRRGSAITEIRAREVVVYDTTLSKSEENLSILGRPDHGGSSYETGEGQGRVSRMLQKFDSNYGKLQKKSRSTENLLDLESGASGRPRLRPKPQPDPVPKPSVLHPQPGSPVRHLGKTQSSSVFQPAQSSKPKSRPAVPEPEGPCSSAGPPQSVSSFRQRFEGGEGHGAALNHTDETDGAQPRPSGEWDSEGGDVTPNPKVPCSPEARRARAESPAGAFSFKASQSSSEFEIRPSPKPDLSLIPDEDTQAKALANLRLQSRNSFTVIPKRHSSALATPGAAVPSPSQRQTEVPSPTGVPSPHAPTPVVAPSKLKEEEHQPEEAEEAEEAEGAAMSPKPDPPASPVSATTHASPSTSTPPPAPSPDQSTPSAPSPVPSVSPVPSPVPSVSPVPSPVPSSPEAPSPAPEETPTEQLPVTNIDDIEVEPHHQALAPSPSPVVQRRKGNTFTVVPRRKVESPVPDAQEPQQEAAGGPQPASTPAQAPYAQLGSLLKKRYPAVEEIEVIGGYLSLGKSCLSKIGSTGKKLKISFNESSLHSTYEYPSESSVWDSEGEEEGEEEGARPEETVSDDQPSMVGRIHIPRPSFTTSTANSTDLSNYIPKHSVDFNAWQEHKLDDAAYQGDADSQPTQVLEEVMLTPADSSSLSDFSSEPALYF